MEKDNTTKVGEKSAVVDPKSVFNPPKLGNRDSFSLNEERSFVRACESRRMRVYTRAAVFTFLFLFDSSVARVPKKISCLSCTRVDFELLASLKVSSISRPKTIEFSTIFYSFGHNLSTKMAKRNTFGQQRFEDFGKHFQLVFN